MQWSASANRAHHLHARALAVRAIDVHNLIALAHRQIDRLPSALMQFAHRLECGIAHRQASFDQVAELEEAHAEAIRTRRVGPIYVTADDQVIQDPMRSRWMQPSRTRQMLK